ncbi:class I SAM-dependent methyltransferase [Herbivorax sp. ANBcel31]|uniref:class I SAM-dependent methyltransferase n=1 Tax=Herbivorax sp. ANBcel31 TaxID=3069754 RepID=UPI0027AE0660|nr:class I SAM-dependent methyltransferase [Herbivorax sp. ANBcel31]MDQ2087613.1 class I SAM-dependent methyltransferase [Herbivorax sp. ANBcel31]
MNHYYSKNPDIKHDLGKINYKVNDHLIELITDAGVFSKNKVDFGSDLLIKSVPPFKGTALDIGCGYGILGISLALLNSESFISMIDINSRAIDLTLKNIKLNNVKNASAFLSDGFLNVSDKFDLIVTNPPIRTGKKVIYPIYESSINFLNTGGSIYLVVQKKQGALSTIEKLNSIYGNCEVIAKDKGYWIIKSTKSS